MADAIRQLVSEAGEYVEINRDDLDRDFYRVQPALTIEELGVEFAMGAPQTSKIRRVIADYAEDTFVTDCEVARSNPPAGRTTVRFVVPTGPVRTTTSAW